MKKNLLLFFALFTILRALSQTAPVVTSFTPLSGAYGSTVTITGSNFSTVPADNVVFFGNVKATVTAATTVSLSVIVPASATYDYISVTANSKTAYSLMQFNPTFSCGALALDTNSFIRPASKYISGYDNIKTTTPQGSVVGDVDGDGKQDLIVAHFGDSLVTIFRNIGTPGTLDSNSFTKYMVRTPIQSLFQATMGDLDGDGKPELVFSCFGRDTLIVFKNNSTPGSVNLASGTMLAMPVTGSGCSIKIGDLDADGKPEIVVVNRNKNISIFKNNISGSINVSSFTRSEILVGNTVQLNDIAIADINMDGKPDLVTGELNAAKLHVFINNSALSFTDNVITTGFSGIWGIAVADLDGDGKMDISGHHRSNNTFYVYRNTTSSATPTFASAYTLATSGIQLIYTIASDLNGDGKPDLVSANLSATGNAYIFQNNSTPGTISLGAPFHLKTLTAGIIPSVSDIDQDGFPDIFIPDNAKGGFSFRNANGTKIYVQDIDTVSGTGSVLFPYTTLGVAPTQYSINWSVEALAAGFINVNTSTMPSSPLTLALSASAPEGIYSGTITVSSVTCTADPVPFNIILTMPNISPSFVKGSSQELLVCANSGTRVIDSLLAVEDLNNGQTITWSVQSDALHGTLAAAYNTNSTGDTLWPTGLTYKPDSGYVGTDTFTVSVSDGFVTDSTMIIVSVTELPALSLSDTNICYGSTVATLAYSGATGSPVSYSVIWDADAISKGFVNSTDETIPAGSVDISVPANAPAASYTGTMYVKNANGCESAGIPVLIIIDRPLQASEVTGINGPVSLSPPLNDFTLSDNTGWTVIHVYNTGGTGNTWSTARAIPFDFNFMGQPVNNFCVSKNYLLTFDSSVAGDAVSSTIADNTSLPNADLPNSTIAYLWDNFTIPGGSPDDAVYTRVYGNAPNRQLWIRNNSYATQGMGFSYGMVVLEETTNKIYIIDARNQVSGAGSRTVGIQKDATTAVQDPGSPAIQSINGNVGPSGWTASAKYWIFETAVPVITDTISFGQVPAAFSSVNPPAGGSGDFSYTWEDSTANGLWTQAPGTNNSAGYQAPALLQTTWFRRSVTDNICGTVIYDNIHAEVILNAEPSVPVDQDAAANTVMENAANGTAVGISAFSTDPEGRPVKYILTDHAGGRFKIDSITGSVSVANGLLLNYENNTSHTITVRASDSILTSAQTFTINITDQNEMPVITSNGGGDSASVVISENDSVVTTVTATDPDEGAGLLYAIINGADRLMFTIDQVTGVLTFNNKPDFEHPLDSDADNSYEATVRVSDGMLTRDQAISVTVTDLNEAPSFVSGIAYAFELCENADTISIDSILKATDGDNNQTITWSIVSPPGHGSLNGFGSVAISNSDEIDPDGLSYIADQDYHGADSFSVAVSDGSVTAQMKIKVVVNALPSVNAGSDIELCEGESALLKGSGASTYSWDHGIADSVIFMPSATAAYTLTGTDLKGCVNADEVIVTVNPNPSAGFTINDDAQCENDNSFELNDTSSVASGTLTRIWDFGNGDTSSVSSESVIYNAADMYTVKLLSISEKGCRDSVSKTVTVFAKTAATATAASATTLCNGGSVSIDANPGSGLTYQWLDNNIPVGSETNRTYTATVTGAYRVIVTNANTCSDTSSVVNVTVNQNPVATATAASATTFCDGGNVIINGNNETGLTYEWLNNNSAISLATNNTYTAWVSGSYSVIVTDANTCRDTSDAVEVTVNANPVATATVSSATTFCNGSGVEISATNGTGLTYEWLNDNSPLTSETTRTYTATETGNYTVVVTNIHSCRDTSAVVSVTVHQNPVATATAASATTFCDGNDVIIHADNETGLTYQWLDNNSPINLETSNAYTAFAGGSYSVIVIDDNTCRDTSDAVEVTVNANPVATATVSSATTFCDGSGVEISATNGTGLTYEWLNDNSPVASEITQTYTATETGSYSVVVTNIHSCRDTSAVVNITVHQNPVATATAASATTFCDGGNVMINANNETGLTYQWLDNNAPVNTETNNSYSATVSGNYSVIITDGNTCRDTSDAIAVTVNANPVAIATAASATTFCDGGNVTIDATAGAGLTYQWLNAGAPVGSETAQSYTANTTGIYRVVVTDINSCHDTSAMVQVTVNELPEVYSITGGGSYCASGAGAEVGLSSSQTGISYRLYNGTLAAGSAIAGTGSSISFGNQAAAGTYTVKAINAATSCGPVTMTGSVDVIVDPLPAAFAVTGGGAYCDGGTGVAIELSNSQTGIHYQLYHGTSAVGGVVAGSGALIGFGNFTSAGNYTVQAINAATSCGPVTMTGSADVVVNPLPLVFTVTGGGVYCAGGTGVTVGLNNSETGVTYQLYNGSVAAGSPVAGTGSSVSFGNQTAAGTYTVKAISSTTSCGPVSMTGSATVTINPVPDVDDLSDETVCNNTGTTAVTFTGSITGTIFNWTNDLTSIGLAAGGSGYLASFTAANTTSTAVTAAITVTPSANGCVGAAKIFTVTVNPTPGIDALTDQVLCNGTYTDAVAFTGAVTGTQFNWTNDETSIGLAAGGSGDITSYASINTTGIPVIATVKITPSANGCNGSEQTITYTVNPTPAIETVSDQNVCNNTATSLVRFTGPVSGTTFDWTNDLAAIGLAASGSGEITSFTAVNSGTLPLTATVEVTPTANNCAGAAESFTFTVSPSPEVSAVPDQTLCHGVAAAAISFNGPVNGTIFKWTNDQPTIGLAASGTGDIASFTATNTTDAPVTASIVVTPAGGLCTGEPKIISITVNPVPDVAAPSNQARCNGAATAAIPFTGTVSGTVFNWTNDQPSIGLAAAGSGDIASFTAVNTTADPVTATITVTPTANGCTGASQIFTITVNPTVVLTSTLAPPAICNNTSFNYVPVSDTKATTFAWERAAVTGISNTAASGNDDPGEQLQNTTPDPVNVVYSYTLTANGCSNTQNVSVVVNPSPELSGPAAATVCSGTQFNYTPSSATAVTSFIWNRTAVSDIIPSTGNGTGNIDETLVNASLIPVDVIYNYTLTAFGCQHPQQVTLTVDPAPVAPLITLKPAAELCSNTQYANFGAANAEPAGVQYIWSAANAAVWSTGSDKQYCVVNFPAAGTGVVTLTALVPGFNCAVKDSFTVQVGAGVSHTPSVRYFNKHFVCMENTVTSYQWGYDDAMTLKPTVLTEEINQNYSNAQPDLANKYYWVLTFKDGCVQKTYYKGPAGISLISGNVPFIQAYPNPANDFILVEMSGGHIEDFKVEIIDMLGKTYMETSTVGGKVNIDVSGLAAGVYFLNCAHNGMQLGSKRFVKN